MAGGTAASASGVQAAERRAPARDDLPLEVLPICLSTRAKSMRFGPSTCVVSCSFILLRCCVPTEPGHRKMDGIRLFVRMIPVQLYICNDKNVTGVWRRPLDAGAQVLLEPLSLGTGEGRAAGGAASARTHSLAGGGRARLPRISRTTPYLSEWVSSPPQLPEHATPCQVSGFRPQKR